MTADERDLLADLGSRFIALVLASQRLGHETHAMTAHYIHAQDEAAALVEAVARGRAVESALALRTWLDTNGMDAPMLIDQPAKRQAARR